MTIQFIDLKAQLARIKPQMHSAILAAVDAGQYIMGPQVAEFEKQLSAFSGARHTVSCANGTDALALPLLAWGVGPGDAVFCPSFTYVATAEILPWCGASAVFVDIRPDTYNMDPASLEAAIEGVKREGKLRPAVVIAVDLFGQPADYPSISSVAKKHGLKLISDSAQGFGCTLQGKHPIQWADAVTTSFFPAKPLGCYGDGGAVQTNDSALAEVMDSLRVHGKATRKDVEAAKFEHDPKYLNHRIGMNSRLDTLQAAVLLEKLKIFPSEIEARMRIARRYNEGLEGVVSQVPSLIHGAVSVWAQYTIEVPDRSGLAAHLKDKGVPTAVYYPVPIHKQSAYKHFPAGAGGLAVTEAKADRVISLPMHPYLDEATQDEIIEAIRAHNRRK
ncbi:MAG: DegT/DnrJ/EryC1/StrS aminotransferase family protein [Parvularculaceae bacterium]|nr:DegT/DnrJ/EryC1/StrS aminotransferase family protein [Parvularculaceae bacterium]